MKTQSLDIENLDLALDKAMNVVKNYMNNITTEPVIPDIKREDLKTLIHSEIPFEGIGIEKSIEEVEETIVPYCSKIGNPKFLSWIITSPSPAGTIGEIINLGLNQVPFCYKSGPAATVMEEIVISWFSKIFGYSNESGGILVSGGTMGTLTALSVAREAHIPGVMKKGLQNIEKPLTVYVSEIAHKSVETAVSLLGIGSDFIRKIPVDSNFKMDTNKLKQAVKKDKESGYDPFCVVAQAGTSNEGSVDNIDAIADFCNKNNIWLHIDAAFAGGAILTQRGKELMKGIEKADSISTDPHKWFFIPVEAGCVLIKKREHLYNTYKTADKNFNKEEPIEYMNYGIQFTRMSRALKIWFAFRTYGLDKIANIVNQNIDLAQELTQKINGSKNWELLAPTQTSAVCFRYIPNLNLTNEELNKLQHKILNELEKSGKAFIAPAVINGNVAMRTCFANHRTSYEDLNFIFKTLSEFGEKFSK
ncbi:aminotransferase class I/II-fold pyridoxal phosphate-dependent enzyme [Clostridium aestuarii]|uniref:Aminotransferase class I/II-fold pyridoxal phosphate-dependent enzyme n=1 Tax=Clostridium aestuarii TaxID=338193 RepID=A0ABT4CZQ7_9CLOT|nr:aminotransferase class I/II-fold pyridoxal phosphate-dependent enzyme [Clostridium aestuarii]MCY6483293.1 aminotransferase class I/II-fold pyridoxal phosphate-dependent enzyme [Clostridium aestuarii]